MQLKFAVMYSYAMRPLSRSAGAMEEPVPMPIALAISTQGGPRVRSKFPESWIWSNLTTSK